MGLVEEKGIGSFKNPEGAFHYISKAAHLGNDEAMVKLGDYYYSGYHTIKDLQKARQWYEKAAEQDNSQALINLGLLYEKKASQSNNREELKLAK